MLLAATAAACGKTQAPPPPGKPVVDVVTLHSQSVTFSTTLPGRVTPFRIAEVRPQVSGIVQKRLFLEGGTVRRGQQLYQIDPGPYEAALASAKASLAKAEAAVVSNTAIANRYQRLANAAAVSRQDLDTAVASLKQSEADVAAAKASIETARINVAYTRLYAPISGRSGRSSVTEGALVTADQANPLVVVTQLDPVYVDVVQPAATILRLKREAAAGQIARASTNNLPVSLLLEDGSRYNIAGKLQFSEVTVDQSTGSVTMRAIFPNPQGLLLPGMFVQAVVEEGVRQNGILAPQRGITRNPQGQATALIVGPDGKVQQRTLVTDRAIGDNWLVLSGLKDGDRVIVSGIMKARPGATVTPQEAATPASGDSR